MISKHMPITARQTKGYYRVLWLCLVVKLGGSGYIRFLSMFQKKNKKPLKATAKGKENNDVDVLRP